MKNVTSQASHMHGQKASMAARDRGLQAARTTTEGKSREET